LILLLQNHADPFPIDRATGAPAATIAAIEITAKDEFVLVRTGNKLTGV
jgi:hypothetical protein